MLDYTIDVAMTNEYYRRGTFRDEKRRSFVDCLGHLHLRGVDRSDARERLYLARKGICEVCKHYRDRDHGDLHHKAKTSKARCECYHRRLVDGSRCTGIMWVCTMDPSRGGGPGSCHSRIHGREIGGRHRKP